MSTTDLKDVHTFVVVGQEGTLTAAAERLGLPPSTVSRAVTRLERNLDVLLLRRSSRGFTLTDAGKEYLQICRRALRILNDGRESLTTRREQPTGVIRIACPVTMMHSIFGPLLPGFFKRYPDIRVEFEPYCSGWSQEPRDDIDVFFKVRSPKDSSRRVRLYPGTARGLFASKLYLSSHQPISHPDQLLSHRCIGSGVWELSHSGQVVPVNVPFVVTASDPRLHLELALRGLGIVELPLYMARWPENRTRLVHVLSEWRSKPIVLCALFFGPSRLTAKIQVLLDFLNEYIGTGEDPRLRGISSDGLFTSPTDSGKTG